MTSPICRSSSFLGRAAGLLGLMCLLLGGLLACGGGSSSASGPQVAVTGVQLSAGSLALTVGEAPATLTATVQPANASNPAVTWSTSNGGAATVAGGAVTAAGPGSATITVTTVDGGKTATCDVTVTAPAVPVTGISLNQTILGLTQLGATATLLPTVQPANASNPAVTWSSDNTGVATVQAGLVTAAGTGSATIKATTVDGGLTASCAVTVTLPVVPVTGVTLNLGSLSLASGGATSALTATVAPANATNPAVTWSSSTPGVATVVAGVVTPVAPGTTTIKVTTVSGGLTATCPVTVTGPSFGTLYAFSGPSSPALDGAQPKGTLTALTDAGGNTVLYGRTAVGGSNNCGIIFSIHPDGTNYQVLYRFSGADGCNPRHDAMTYDAGTGLLYGTTEGDNQITGATYGNNGQIFSFLPGSPITAPITAIHTFANPSPASAPYDGAQQHSCFIIDPVSGVLYGESGAGGANNLGMLYSVAPDGTGFTDLYDFGTAGNNPHGSPILVNGVLYGIDRTGGSANFGAVYAYRLSNGQYSTLHTFLGGVSDGATSDHGNLTPVTIGGKTILFGMTQYGGTGTGADNGGTGNGGGCGVIFQIDPAAAPGTSAAFNIAYSFQGTEKFDGAWPYGSLLYDGTYLYGTTSVGGAYNKGTVFRFTPPAFGATGTMRVLYHLGTQANDGTKPIDNVIKLGSTLYGLSVYGGAATGTGSGAVFAVPLPAE